MTGLFDWQDHVNVDFQGRVYIVSANYYKIVIFLAAILLFLCLALALNPGTYYDVVIAAKTNYGKIVVSFLMQLGYNVALCTGCTHTRYYQVDGGSRSRGEDEGCDIPFEDWDVESCQGDTVMTKLTKAELMILVQHTGFALQKLENTQNFIFEKFGDSDMIIDFLSLIDIDRPIPNIDEAWIKRKITVNADMSLFTFYPKDKINDSNRIVGHYFFTDHIVPLTYPDTLMTVKGSYTMFGEDGGEDDDNDEKERKEEYVHRIIKRSGGEIHAIQSLSSYSFTGLTEVYSVSNNYDYNIITHHTGIHDENIKSLIDEHDSEDQAWYPTMGTMFTLKQPRAYGKHLIHPWHLGPVHNPLLASLIVTLAQIRNV